MPGLRSTILYWPAPSVMTVRVFSINAGLDASTVTPGSTAPLPSFTTPAIATCALLVLGMRNTPAQITARHNTTRRSISSPLSAISRPVDPAVVLRQAHRGASAARVVANFARRCSDLTVGGVACQAESCQLVNTRSGGWIGGLQQDESERPRSGSSACRDELRDSSVAPRAHLSSVRERPDEHHAEFHHAEQNGADDDLFSDEKSIHPCTSSFPTRGQTSYLMPGGPI